MRSGFFTSIEVAGTQTASSAVEQRKPFRQKSIIGLIRQYLNSPNDPFAFED
jgi:hypothetical protein